MTTPTRDIVPVRHILGILLAATAASACGRSDAASHDGARPPDD